MEYDQTLVNKRKELAKTMQELGGDMDSDDLDYLDQDDFIENLLLDAKYRYSSHTSDEDKKYKTKKNKNLVFWRSAYRKKHVLKLWRKAFAMAHSTGMIINQISAVQTKLQFFGRQMLSRTQEDYKREINKFRGT